MNFRGVVVVDDSAFMRKLIGEMVEEHKGFRVVGKIKSGKEIIEKIEYLSPSIITLDIELIDMSGLEVIKVIREKGIDIPIIVISYRTYEKEVQDFLSMYQNIYLIEKPSGAISLDIDEIKIKLFKTLDKVTRLVLKNKKINKTKVDVVLIGASTGGPKALTTVLQELPSDLNKPVLVVQHMPKGFTKTFSQRLNKICNLKVVEAEEGMGIEKNTIYIAKGGYHLLVSKDKRIILSEESPIWGVRPAVDKLFETGAVAYNGRVLSCVLTGMGKDGAIGTRIIKSKGGTTIAEDEESAIVYGMPRAAVETGCVDYILSLKKISRKIISIIKEDDR